jgi:hypothetical protein
MSLLGWLGSTNKVSDRSLSPIAKRGSQTGRVVLGVLGIRSNIRCEDIDANIIGPIIEAWGLPDEVILPAEGDSSQAIQSWAQLKNIPISLVGCDWVAQGKRAGIFRDARIQREATHLLLLQGPRSNALSSLAERLGRKGRPVVISERPGMPVSAPTISTVTKKAAPK